MAKKYRADKQSVLNRAKRAAGQANAVVEMIENDEYCIDVLTQIAASRAALTSLAQVVLAEHMDTCVAEALEGGDAQPHIQELTTVLSRFVK